MCDIKSLANKCGSPNPPGTKAVLYVIPAEEVLTMPAVGDGSVAGNTKIYNTAWSLSTATGKGYWRTFNIIKDSGQETFSMVGEEGGRSFENGLAFMIAGMDAEVREASECLANGCWIAMIKDRKDEHPLVFGTNEDPATFREITADSGKKTGDTKAVSFVLGDGTGKIPLKYDSSLAINLTPNA